MLPVRCRIQPEDLEQDLNCSNIQLFSSRYNGVVVEGYTYDLVDETVNRYLDRMESILKANS